jgi:UDP-GlcNAc:undecaprenyl-phosphate/decaprenyl-phosphate GlcNAc-1-phosphate transferase
MSILVQLILCFLSALIIALYAIPIIVRVDRSLKLYDEPNERSSNSALIPTLGGIAIFFSFIFTANIGMLGYSLPELNVIMGAMLLVFFVGLKDDLANLSPFKKLLAEIIAACIIIFPGNIRFSNLHGLFGLTEIGILPSVLISIFAIIVIINAVNLTDGIDGLAASLGIMISFILGVWFFLSGHFNYAILSFSLVGAISGFFYYNVYGTKNKIFMGDTGSLVLGTIIAILIIQFNEFNIDQKQPFAIPSVPAISFGILAYPLMDIMRVILIRIIQRRSVFEADKNHLHHRLLLLGFAHHKATFTIIGINILFISLVFALHSLGILRLTFYILITGSILFMIPALIIQKRKLIRNDDPVQQLLMPQF